MSRAVRRSRVPAPEGIPELKKTPKTSIQYRKLQASSLVTAAAVARFTDARLFQLVIFKEMTMEVWEVEETRQRKVVSGVLERPVSHCCVLETSKLMSSCQEPASIAPHCDLLLVTDGSGGLTVFGWNESLSELQEPGQIKVHLSPELKCETEVLPSIPLFSCPLYLPKRAALKRSNSPTEVQHGMTSKVEGIALVAMSLYQGMLGILCVEFTSTYPTLLKECGVSPIKPSLTLKLNLHFVALTTESSTPSPMAAIANPFVVRDLAFLGADEGADYGSLDLNGRPLLVLLSSQQGSHADNFISSSVCYMLLQCGTSKEDAQYLSLRMIPSAGFLHHSLRLQCMALDLSTFQLRPGPWEIRNVNPSTSLLLPWSVVGNLGDVVGVKGDYYETGLRFGSGVLAVCSAGLMFVEASGRRALLPLQLDGLPTCWIRLPQNHLVLGDDTGALHMLELSSWKQDIISKIVLKNPLPSVKILVHVLRTKVTEVCSKARKEHFGDNVIFVSGQAGDSQLLKLIRTGEPIEGLPVDDGDKWFGKSLVVEPSALLDCLAPMRDIILIKEAIHCPDPFLLLACGNSPASTVRKGSLMAVFHVDTIVDADVRGLPQLLPFHEFWGLEFHTHILVSYPIANNSEVMTINGTRTEDHFMCGLERRQSTLALSALPGGWFLQITETSLRVLGNDTSSRDLRAEWRLPFPPSDSPRNLICSKKIHHAAVTSEGALLVSGAAVFSVEMDCFGLPHTVASLDRPHQVSALGLCYVGDSCLHTVARELVVVIAQWTTNTVHLLSWPNLEELVTMDACTAPVLSVALGRLAMYNYLFAGTADGNLVYYKLSDTKRSRNGNEEVANFEGPPSAMDEEVGESRRMLRRIRTMGIVPSNLQANKSILESEHLKLPQYTLRHGRVIKVGSSITHMEFGCFNGGGYYGGTSSRTESSGSEIDEECLYVWSERSLVLLPQQLQDFHAVVLHCQSHPVPKSTQYSTIPLVQLHAEEHPHGLVGATTDGKLLCGHLDLSIKLRWQVLKVEGTAVHLAHHKSSGCIAFICIDGVSSNLHIAHEVSMLPLLIVELECNHLPKVLATLQLPYTIYSPNAESVECLVVATQTVNEQQTTGFLFFFDVQVNYASEKEVKYELRMLGLHPLDQPCYSICMVDTPCKPFTPSPCAMCNLGSLPVADDPWLLDVLQCLENASKHWSRCCIDRSSDSGAPQKDADHPPRGPLLALGFKGKVELLHVFVGASEACMLVVPSIAAVLDAPFLPLAGIHEECDELPEGVEDVDERSTSTTEAAAEDTLGVQPTPTVHCGLSAKWTTSSRINVQNLASFNTPGAGCVTTLVPMPKGTILVVEKLNGLSVFEIAGEGSEIVQLAWHPCSSPLEAVIPLSDDLYMLSMYGNGCEVMERDYPAEEANQIQEKLRKDLENELMSVQDQVQDGTPRSTIILELQRSSMERLPRLKHVTAASWTGSAYKLSSGSLSLESMPFTRMPIISKMVRSIAAVTPTGEVLLNQLSVSITTLGLKLGLSQYLEVLHRDAVLGTHDCIST